MLFFLKYNSKIPLRLKHAKMFFYSFIINKQIFTNKLMNFPNHFVVKIIETIVFTIPKKIEKFFT